MRKFCWNKDTINHFKFISNYGTVNEVHNMVKEFVAIGCDIWGNEIEEELVTDLMNTIYE